MTRVMLWTRRREGAEVLLCAESRTGASPHGFPIQPRVQEPSFVLPPTFLSRVALCIGREEPSDDGEERGTTR